MDVSEKKPPLETCHDIVKPFTLSIHPTANDIDPKVPNEGHSASTREKKETRDDLNFTIPIYKDFKIRIYKPLILLKMAQFSYFGAGSFMVGFMTVFLKQRGVSLTQLSWMTVIAPFVQIMGTAISGVAVDKIGNSKPVLMANLLLVMSVVGGILFMPSMNGVLPETQTLNFSCPSSNLHYNIKLKTCFIQQFENINELLNDENLTCVLKAKESDNKVHSSVHEINFKLKYNESCHSSKTLTPSESIFNTWCDRVEDQNCQLYCTVTSNPTCQVNKESRDILFIGYVVLYVMFLSFYSNTYRCFDITSMGLVKEHNADFGIERFFAMTGNLMISPLAGLIVNSTSEEGGEKNYAAAFYLFIGMIFLVLGIVYKLPVSVNTPGEKMWKKTFYLLKNPDILSLILVITILGTAWNFTKIFVFWYLADLNAPSLLVGLIPSLSALYGMPFLLTSDWWVKKIGSTNLIIIALVAYVFMCTGYSFITNPWYSLTLETFGAVAYYLLWVAVVIHCHELAPDGLRGTIVAVAGAIHFCLGKVSAALMGGMVMNSFGGRVAFRLIAIICLIAAILYGLYLRIRNTCVSKELQLDQSSENQLGKESPSSIFVIQKTS